MRDALLQIGNLCAAVVSGLIMAIAFTMIGSGLALASWALINDITDWVVTIKRMPWIGDVLTALITIGLTVALIECWTLRTRADLRRRFDLGAEASVERIGRCDTCGEIDHHLIMDMCPNCREKFGKATP